MKFLHIIMGLGFLTAALMTSAWGQTSNQDQQKKIKAAIKAVNAVAVKGPKEVTLKNQGKLKIPAGMVYVKQPEAENYMVAIGNSPDPQLVGLVFPIAKDQYWITTVDFTKSGYIRDGDAKEWKSENLLKSLKEGTKAGNVRRVELGFPALEILDWIEEPHYDAVHNRLVWSLLAKDKGADDKAEKTVNYNTYALGREGYFSLNLLTSDKKISQERQHAHYLLENLAFNPGKKYADFNEKTDKVAAYGLTALVGGGLVAKKLGLFAIIGAFLLKGWKLLLIGLAVIGGGIGKLFGRNKQE